MADIKQVLKEKSGIRLDIGCGENKQPGFVGMDMQALPGVDIVHDMEIQPWPLPDECVTQAVASHILEHINPAQFGFINVMNELWRVMKPGAQFAFVVPYAGSHGFFQDPTHVNPINETTMHYFDPDPEGANIGQSLYAFYRPKPWKIIRQYYNPVGNLEVLLEKRPMDRSFTTNQVPMSITEEVI